MSGQNVCPWLLLGSIKQCGKSCINEYCGIHRYQIRQGGGTNPCIKCGVGVKNVYRVCMQCGFYRERYRLSRALSKEFKRLAAIEISC